MIPYALTIFLSAFLLFQVQPLMGKYLLPWFGGAPAVWTTCMLFYQVLLLGGYAYAHWTVSRFDPRVQRRVHVGHLFVSTALAVLLLFAWKSPILPPPAWKPNGAASPTAHILGLLGAGVGLPYFLLATTSPVLQVWFRHPRTATAGPRRQPLRIGIVGLGVGTTAAYARAGDYVRFYEINPEVVRLSLGPRSYFSYLRECPATVDVVLGDARVSMERELERSAPQAFDVLAVDAFSSDAIPVHLLTREAIELYLGHLRAWESILAVHISNHYSNLFSGTEEMAVSPSRIARSSFLIANSAASRFPFDTQAAPTVSTGPISRNGAGWNRKPVRHQGLRGGTGWDAALSALKEEP